MIVRDPVVLIQGDFVVFVRGSSKYAGKGQPLNLSISLTAATNIVPAPRQKAKSIWGSYSSPCEQSDRVHHREDEDAY